MRESRFLLPSLLYTCLVQVQDTYRTNRDVLYISGSETDAYHLERCKLDIYYPRDKEDSSAIVWFHDGSVEGGSKFTLRELTDQGFAVVAVNYRLSSKTKSPAYIEDTAEAVAWTLRNIEKYGGRKDRIFVSGHSAGDCLTLILAMDKEYVVVYGADANSVAAYPPVSGQMVTYSTIRKERGLPNRILIIDEFAPVNKIRKDTVPVMLITGDKNLEIADRYGENALLASALKDTDNRKVSLYKPQGLDHGQVLGPACYLIVNYVRRFK